MTGKHTTGCEKAVSPLPLIYWWYSNTGVSNKTDNPRGARSPLVTPSHLCHGPAVIYDQFAMFPPPVCAPDLSFVGKIWNHTTFVQENGELGALFLGDSMGAVARCQVTGTSINQSPERFINGTKHAYLSFLHWKYLLG